VPVVVGDAHPADLERGQAADRGIQVPDRALVLAAV
jgi:hypothetical protein